VRLFAPFVSEPVDALEAEWFEHNTGKRVTITTEDPMGKVVERVVPVKTYGELARQYGEHPEVKFADQAGRRCQPRTSGTLGRRHVIATRTEPYGKEGNALRRRVEGAGVSDEVQGLFVDPADFERHVLPVGRAMQRRELAAGIGVTERGLRKILNGHSGGTPTSRAAIARTVGTWSARRLGRRPSENPVDDCAAWLSQRVRPPDPDSSRR